jgi:hypothetical protein
MLSKTLTTRFRSFFLTGLGNLSPRRRSAPGARVPTSKLQKPAGKVRMVVRPAGIKIRVAGVYHSEIRVRMGCWRTGAPGFQFQVHSQIQGPTCPTRSLTQMRDSRTRSDGRPGVCVSLENPSLLPKTRHCSSPATNLKRSGAISGPQ